MLKKDATGMGNEITAADFIIRVEENLNDKTISANQRKTLLNNIPHIVDNLSKYGNGTELTFRTNADGDVLVANGVHTQKYSSSSGLLLNLTWKNNHGDYHRDEDNPAVMVFYAGEKIQTEIWYKNNKIHREGDKPAIIEYGGNSKVRLLQWREKGTVHRKKNDSPAAVAYFENGNLKTEEWYEGNTSDRHGAHRANGKPARVLYEENGTVKKEEFWANGLPVPLKPKGEM